jgi:hypothetical protein
MPNPFYTNTIDLIDGTKARASAVESNFAAVEAGFDSVETAKANVNSPAFTGTPTAPTPAQSSNNTTLATTAYVSQKYASGVTGMASTIRETQTATASQTVFNLTNVYTPGANNINIFINGVRQFPSTYSETNSTRVTFTDPLNAGDVVMFEFGVITSGTVQAASAISFQPTVGNASTTVQDAIGTVLPTQNSTTNGRILLSNGTTASWGNLNVANELRMVVDSTITLTSPLGSSSNIQQVVALDAARELLLIRGSGNQLHAVVFSNGVFGTPVLVRSGAVFDANALLTATDRVLVVSLPSTTAALEAVVLSFSGTTITVNTAVNATLAGNSSISQGSGRIYAFGSSYVFDYQNVSSLVCLRAITISGTTPTIGAELALTGFAGTDRSQIHAVSATVALVMNSSNTVLYATPVTVSGSSLSKGTEATTTISSAGGICSSPFLTGGRWVALYQNSGMWAAVVSVSGTTATMSTVNTTLSVGGGNGYAIYPIGNQAIVFANGSTNVVTDNSGTAAIGTSFTPSGSVTFGFGWNATNTAMLCGSATGSVAAVGISGNNPILLWQYANTIDSGGTTTDPLVAFRAGYSNLQNGSLRTSAGKYTALIGNSRPFATISADQRSAYRAFQLSVWGTQFNAPSGDAAWGISTNAGNVVNIRKVQLV